MRLTVFIYCLCIVFIPSCKKREFGGDNRKTPAEAPELTPNAENPIDPNHSDPRYTSESKAPPRPDNNTLRPSNTSPSSPLESNINPTAGQKTSVDHTLNFTCAARHTYYVGTEAMINGLGQSFAVTEDQKVTITATGQLCPKINQQAEILFMVDASGSMGKDSKTPPGGNDPIRKDKTCGRYDAVMATLALISQNTQLAQSVKFRAITFATKISDEVGSSSLQDFRDLISKEHGKPEIDLCKVETKSGRGYTNYEAALNKAAKIANNNHNKRQTIVYFITDGLPTIYNSLKEVNKDETESQKRQREKNAQSYGLKSARSLHTSFPHLTFLSIFLYNSTAISSQEKKAADTYLKDITSPDGISRIYTSVDGRRKLPKALEEITTEALDIKSGAAIFIAKGYPAVKKNLNATISPLDTGSHKEEFSFSMTPSPLLGLDSVWVENIFTLTAQRADGTPMSSKMTFYYCKSGQCGTPPL